MVFQGCVRFAHTQGHKVFSVIEYLNYDFQKQVVPPALLLGAQSGDKTGTNPHFFFFTLSQTQFSFFMPVLTVPPKDLKRSVKGMRATVAHFPHWIIHGNGDIVKDK